MKKLVLIAALFTPVAKAQFVVHDPASLFGLVQQFEFTMDKLGEQLDKAEEIRGAIGNVKDLGDIYDEPSLRQYLGEDLQDAYRAFRRSGYEGLVREGIEIYARNQVYDLCKSRDEEDTRKNCEASRAQPSQVYGDSVEALQNLRKLSEAIEETKGKIENSSDLNETANLTARLQYLQSEQQTLIGRTQIMNNLQEANNNLMRDKQRQIDAKAFSSKKGIQAEPPTFNLFD